jgi:hypothetical protein
MKENATAERFAFTSDPRTAPTTTKDDWRDERGREGNILIENHWQKLLYYL